MAQYLIEVGYTPQAWSTQVDKQADVRARITPALDACGATLESCYYAFGDVDLVAVIDFPTPEDAAAFGMTVTASGALRSYRTIPLLSVEQGIAAMQRAEELRKVYSPPLTVSLVEQPVAAR